MKKTILTALAVSGALLATGVAQAASLGWTETGTEVTNAPFDPSPDVGLPSLANGSSVSVGYLTWTADLDGAIITFTYLGQESGFSDGVSRSIDIGDVLLDESNAAGDEASFMVGAGEGSIIDFRFFDSAGGAAINGGAWSLGSSIGLLATNFTTIGYGTFAYILGFNDSDTQSNDWDDFIIGVNIAKVPEPTTLALFGLGLVGLGLSRRRK